MTSSMKAGIIGIGAGIAIAAVVFWGFFNNGDTDGGWSGDGGNDGRGGNGSGSKRPVPMEDVVKKPIPVSSVERIVPRTMKGEFSLVGRGEDTKWGLAKTANFKYTCIVIADSQIENKEVLPGGEIKVTEIRTFKTVQDSVVVSDVDMKLSLKTLPIKEFSHAIDLAATAWASLTGDVATGAAVIKGKEFVNEKLRQVDGISVRALLGATGLCPTQDMEAAVNKLAGAHVLKALGGIRAISGKSYKITYYQKQSGQPLYVKFTYSNGDPVTDEDEKMVLKRVNAFIDYNLVPNKDCMPGDTWKVQAADMQEIFDPYVEGTYSGEIQAVRRANTNAGDWMVQFSPSVIDITNDSGNTTGHLNLSNGFANINPTLLSVNEMFVEGKASLQKLSKHHWLFTARIAGECDFQGRVVTTQKK